MRKVDHTCWGSGKDFPIILTLEEILNEQNNDHIVSKVNLRINRFYMGIRELDKMTKKSKEFYAPFLLKHTENVIKSYNYPIAIETHLLNFLTAIYRVKILYKNKKN